MKVEIVKAGEFHHRAGDIVSRVIDETEHPNICFPTGDSPQGLYAELVNRHQNGTLSLANIRAIGLDEWGELEVDHPARCISRMRQMLYSQTDVNADNIHFLEPTHKDIEADCRAYDEQIAKLGGLTLSILGVGLNGHIGFNEPGSKITDRTRVVTLAERTIQVGQKYGFSKTPTWGVTVGLATLYESKEILIIVLGAHKAEIVHQLVHGPITSDVPASLFRDHPNCTLLVDTEAASKL